LGREGVRVTVDTNVLIRAVMRDDVAQADIAASLLRDAEIIALPLPCLCEFVWVLRRVYSLNRQDIHAALQALLNAGNVAVNRPAVEAGLAMLDAGGDFADGVIAMEGQWLGGETFVSFDRQAVALLDKQGQAARVAG
jgi:predicted nucleic-acid-binding protein